MTSISYLVVLALTLLIGSSKSLPAASTNIKIRNSAEQVGRSEDIHESNTRQKRDSGSEESSGFVSFKETPPSRVEAALYSSVVLECQAFGSPAPTIHWLKDGSRVEQSVEDNALVEDIVEGGSPGLNTQALGLATTSSRLYIDCVTSEDMGQYSCITENRYERISTETKITAASDDIAYPSSGCKVAKRTGLPHPVPARVYMWTDNIVDLEGVDVIFFCRAFGTPRPAITWYDRDDNVIEDGDKFEVLATGDLRIRSITWMEHMGLYRCVAENQMGAAEAQTFIYPTALE